MLSAEVLRKAAAKMRATAQAATPGPWHRGHSQDGELLADGTGYVGDYYPNAEVIAYDSDGYCALALHAGRDQDAEHIASWHPAVALAVADLFDDLADHWQSVGPLSGKGLLKIATTYLGESA